MDRPSEKRELNNSLDEERAQSIVARILVRRGTAFESTEGRDHSWDARMLEGEARAGTRHIQSQRNSREDASEIKYRQIRLECAVLVGLGTTQSEEEADTSPRELVALAEMADSQALDIVIRKRARPDLAIYLGSGKTKEFIDIVRSVKIDTVVADEELTPSQRRNFEDVTDVKVVGRTTLIFSIFVQHAESREGRA